MRVVSWNWNMHPKISRITEMPPTIHVAVMPVRKQDIISIIEPII